MPAEEEYVNDRPRRIDDYCIYEEAKILLEVSILIYAVTDVRDLARKGKLQGDPALIERSLGVGFDSSEHVFGRLFKENKDTLQKSFGKESFEIQLEALESLKTTTAIQRCVVFDDEPNSGGCVYTIFVDDQRQRIVVVFRGSANAKDWLEDSQVYLKPIPNPVTMPGPQVLGIHAGFHDYLFATNRDGKCKCDKILNEVIQLLEQYPRYHICATGHSLGASLATLFAFQAAASRDSRIPKPIMCVNFASPRPGDQFFRNAFQTLEEKRQVRCLRFVNKGDVITSLPATQICCFTLISKGIFRHVGMEVELCTEQRQRRINFIYAAPGDGKVRRLVRRFGGDVKKLTEQLAFLVTLPFQCLRGNTYMLRHSCLQYLKHVRLFRGDLENVTICDLYEDVYEEKGDFNIRASLSR